MCYGAHSRRFFPLNMTTFAKMHMSTLAPYPGSPLATQKVCRQANMSFKREHQGGGNANVSAGQNARLLPPSLTSPHGRNSAPAHLTHPPGRLPPCSHSFLFFISIIEESNNNNKHHEKQNENKKKHHDKKNNKN